MPLQTRLCACVHTVHVGSIGLYMYMREEHDAIVFYTTTKQEAFEKC